MHQRCAISLVEKNRVDTFVGKENVVAHTLLALSSCGGSKTRNNEWLPLKTSCVRNSIWLRMPPKKIRVLSSIKIKSYFFANCAPPTTPTPTTLSTVPKVRTFQAKWLQLFPCLRYNEKNMTMHCVLYEKTNTRCKYLVFRYIYRFFLEWSNCPIDFAKFGQLSYWFWAELVSCPIKLLSNLRHCIYNVHKLSNLIILYFRNNHLFS